MVLRNIVSSIAAAVVGGGVVLAAGKVVGSQEDRMEIPPMYSSAPICAELREVIKLEGKASITQLYIYQYSMLGCDPNPLARILINRAGSFSSL